MKKVICLLLVLVMAAGAMLVFTSCGSKDQTTLVCGVTEYDPMNFRDSNGNWTGFDTEFALLVGDKLGMEVTFQEIEWSNKFVELDAGAIDAIWNGFTATANEADGTPRITLCDMSYSYMLNTQCVVVRADRLGEFGSIEALLGKTIAVESGSAGEVKALELVGPSGNTIGAAAQINTLLEVMSGAADGAVIDLILAQELTGQGDYSALTVAGNIELGDEVFAIGFKTGSPLRDRINGAMVELYNDGTLRQLAQKYGVDNRLYVDQTFGR